MRRFLILWHILILPVLANAQNCGLGDTIRIGANSTINYPLEVTDVVNDDLSDPNQGICGIEVEFIHFLSEDLEMWLTSPSGQMIQLTGPNTTDQFAFTFSARWDITFVQCAATAVPDSGYVAQWNNGQPRNFVSGGRYNGSYYPFNGCLEDFNTGPVNGTWTITIRNNPSPYQGAILDFRLRLCDERGFLCCSANAGSLASYPDETFCEGSEELLLDIPPIYSGIPPDTTEYGYTYLISQNDILLAYDSLPDLRGYAPGTYQVCGLSYRRIDQDSFPLPDGNVRLSQMRQQLNDNLLLYCGNVTTNCINITITTPPDTTFLNEIICQGEPYTIGNQMFNAAGEYDVNLTTPGGCDSIIHLILTVEDPVITNLTETICAGDSIRIGNSIYKASGSYTDVLDTSNGCDSTVNLTLTVLNPIERSLTANICAGDAFTVGNQTFSAAGSFRIPLQSAGGCDSIVNLTLNVIAPAAIIQPAQDLTCDIASVTLDGSASTPANGLNYSWQDMNGNDLGIGATLDVTDPGNYVLLVELNTGATTCAARDTITVNQDISNGPVANAGTPRTINCINPEVTLNGGGSTQGQGISYRWSGAGIVSGGTTLSPRINQPGDYQLVVSNASGSCRDTSVVQVAIDTIMPIADTGNGFALNCEISSVTLGGTNTSTGANITYEWETTGGNFLGPTDARTVAVDAPGSYMLTVRNTTNGCTTNSLTVVVQNINIPTAEAGAPDTITCSNPQAVLDGSNSTQGNNITYTWRDATGNIVGTNNMEFTGTPGRYFLEVRNTFSRCFSIDSVDIVQEFGVPTITFGDSQIACDSNTLSLQAFVDPTNGNYSFAWQGPGISGATDQITATVDQPGNYTLTVTNLDNGCTDSETIVVTQQDCDICIDSTLPDTLTCNNLTVTLEATFCADCTDCTIAWTTPDGNFISGTDGLMPTVDAPGTYTLTVTNSSNFTVSTDFVVIENVEIPTADAGNNMAITCDQPSVTIGTNNTSTGTQFSYAWTSENGSAVTPADMPMGTVTSPDIYYLDVINLNTGCTARDTVIVDENTNLPTAEAGITQALTCNDPTATLNGTGSSTGAEIVYNWTTQNGNILSGANGLNPVVDAAGTYFLTVTDSTSLCFSMDSVIITADELPQIPPIPNDTLTCDITSVTLLGTLPANGTFQGRWCELDANNNPINCVDGLTLMVTTPGMYRFEVTDMNSGCSASETVEVIGNFAVPMVNAGADDTLTCTIPERTLNAIVSPDGNYSYLWTAVNGSAIQNETTLQPTVSQADTYILQVTNLATGCAATDSLVILMNDMIPTVFAGFDTTLNCTTSSIRLNATVLGNNIDYQWITSDGNIVSGGNTANPTINQPGTYTLMATNSVNGCSAQDAVIVAQSADAPTIVIANADNLALDCNNNTATLDASSSTSATGAALQFLWTATNGTITGNPNQAIVQTSTGGMFQVQITDTQNGCSTTQTITVDADFKKPEFVIATPQDLTCIRDEVTLSASNSTPGADFTVQWFDPNGNPLNETDLTIMVSEPGTYQLQITRSENGCSETMQVTVGTNIQPPTVNIAPPVTLDCQNTTTQLIANATGGSNFAYAWSSQNGVIEAGRNSSTATVAGSGNYSVLVTNQDNGCTAESSIEVDGFASTIREGFLTVATPDCAIPNSGLIAIDSVVGGAAPYVYSLNGGTFSSFSTFRELAPGDYDLVIQDRDGCEWDTSVTVPEPEAIFVSLPDDITIDFGDSIELVPTIIPDTFAFVKWTPSNLVDTNTINQSVAPPETTTFIIEVTGTNGCTVKDEIIVFVDLKISAYAPNAFSPNGDGFNDIFTIFGGDDIVSIKTFMIFDRWGNRLYESGPFPPNDYNYGWDGRFNGEPMDVGVYVFFAELELDDGRTTMLEGDITLIR